MEDATPQARRLRAGGAGLSAFRVALLQLLAEPRSPDANLESGERWCRAAAASGADLALFPELWSVGYGPFAAGDAVERAGPFVAHFAALARELRMAIGVTYLEATARGPRNSLALFDRAGREALHYSKAHLCPWGPPDTDCVAGDDLPVGELDSAAGPVRVGAMICFDREFPETARVLALGGAELILVPNACELARDAEIGDLRLAQFRARAFDCLAALAMANYAAPQHDGHSVAYYPDGQCAALGDESEGIVLAELDLERVRAFRKREIGRIEARRPELYAPLAARAAK